MVGLELQFLSVKFDRFGWERMKKHEKERLMLDWMAALQDYTLDEVKAACRQAVLDAPSKLPNEGRIREIIIRNRQASLPRRREDAAPARERVSADRAAEIVAAAGFSVRRMA